MRRLTAGSVIAAAAAAGFADAQAFVTPAASRPRLLASSGWSGRSRSCSSQILFQQSGQGRREERQGDVNEDEAYGQDDQRRFWDTVVKVCIPILYTSCMQQYLQLHFSRGLYCCFCTRTPPYVALSLRRLQLSWPMLLYCCVRHSWWHSWWSLHNPLPPWALVIKQQLRCMACIVFIRILLYSSTARRLLI